MFMETINLEKIKTQMRKGVLEMCILSIIHKKKEAYASDIMEALKEADMIVVEGTLYPLMTRLKMPPYLTILGVSLPKGHRESITPLPTRATPSLTKPLPPGTNYKPQ